MIALSLARPTSFLSHVLRNFIEEESYQLVSMSRCQFLSHVLRNFIEDGITTNGSTGGTRDS